MQSRRSHANAEHLPGELLERVLAHVPFQERVAAAAVCQAWHMHLSQRGLLLWEAVKIEDLGGECIFFDQERERDVTQQKLQRFLPLLRWLWRYGSGLLQLQCSMGFESRIDLSEDHSLAMVLTTLAAAAPLLQALRIDYVAGWSLGNSSLVAIASMGDRLRQLALIELEIVSDDSVVAALSQLSMLQDLALIFQDENIKENQQYQQGEGSQRPAPDAPDLMWLLDGIAVSCPALQTLALGLCPGSPADVPRWSRVALHGEPLPASISRLSALSSLMLHNVAWEYVPDGLPNVPQLRRLSLRGDHKEASKNETDFPHQLSTLSALEALQVMLPVWPGRLPHSLTQLVVSPLDTTTEDAPDHIASGASFLRLYVPPLSGLRHLAFHGMKQIGGDNLREACTVARALPNLISLHLVNCSISFIPPELCELSRLQLLNLSHNQMLERDGCRHLAQAPLHKLASCRWLDLRRQRDNAQHYNSLPLDPGTLVAFASMPALEQLALPLICNSTRDGPVFPDEGQIQTAQLQLAQRQGPAVPPIRIVLEMPKSDQWVAVNVELPFSEMNNALGMQLDRSIAQGVPL